MAFYRLRVNWTYNTTANAQTAETNINNVLIAAGRPERVTRTTNVVDVMIAGITTEAAAISLRNTLTSAWNVGTRSLGKASLVWTVDPD